MTIFLFFTDFYMFLNGASSSTRRGVFWLLLVTPPLLGRDCWLSKLKSHYDRRPVGQRTHSRSVSIHCNLYCCVSICCSGKVFTVPLPSNGRIHSYHYSGFQPLCHKLFPTQCTTCFNICDNVICKQLNITLSQTKATSYRSIKWDKNSLQQ
jgi:hypothetical protein